MIAVITMQSIDGDCPDNIVVDTEKLKTITLDDCIKYHKVYNCDDETELRLAKERLEDGRRISFHKTNITKEHFRGTL